MFKKMLTKKPVIITLALLLMLTFVFANAPTAFADTFSGSGAAPEPESIPTEVADPQVETPIVHIINFFSTKGEELYGSVSVDNNFAPDLEMVPAITPPENTELLGWYAEGAEVQYDLSAVITGEAPKTINLYAAFSLPSEPPSEGGGKDVPQGAPVIFEVTYNIPGEGGYVQFGEPVSVAENALATEPATPTIPEGYVSFAGWYISANMEGTAFVFSTPITANIQLYAHFSTEYLVSYQNTHGQVFYTQRVAPSATATVPGVAVTSQLNIPEGKIFDCWSTTENGSAYDFSTVVSADVVLFPVLADAIYVYYYSEGTQVDPVVVKKGDKISAPASPTRTGFTFKHWSTEKNGAGAAFNFGTTPISTSDNVFWLYAKWTGKSGVAYKIVYWLEAPGSKAGVTPDTANPGDFVYAYIDTSKKGTAGSMATVNKVPNGSKVPAEFKYAQLMNSSFSAEISGNGTTILNVYLVRKTYTYQFNHEGTMKYGGTTYNSGGYMFDFKYQEDISDRWPGTGKATFSKSDFYGWKSSSTVSGLTWISMRYEVTDEIMPKDANTTSAIIFTAQMATHTKYNVKYYAEVLKHEEGEANLIKIGAISYKEIKEYAQEVGSAGTPNSKQIDGLTYVSKTTNGTAIKFFYTRNVSSLTFDLLAPASEVKNAPAAVDKIKFGEKMGGYKPKTEPTRVGYTFKGWYLDQQFKLAYDFATATMPKGVLLLYAKWESKEITVSFYDGETLLGTKGFAKGDSMPSEIIFGEGAEAKVYAIDNIIGGKQFKGWYYTGAQGSTFILPAGYEFQKDMDLYAQWKTDGFTIKYVKGTALTESGLPTDANTYKKDTTARVLPAGTALNGPGGTTFVGWKKSSESTIFYPYDLITVDGDITLEPVFVKNNELTKITYHVNYEGADEKENKTFSYQKGISINLPDGSFFLRSGYKVVGWANKSTEPQAYAVGGSFIVPTKEKSLYAVWEKTTYTVTFKAGANGTFDAPIPADGVVDKDGNIVFTVNAGTAWNSAWVPAVTANTGYRTNGWNPSPFATAVTENLLYTMQYVQQYTVTFNVGANGTFDAPNADKQQVVYTVDANTAWSGIVLPAVTANEHYTKTGWTPVFPDKITENLEYTMEYSLNTYTVTFKAGTNGTFGTTPAGGVKQPNGDIMFTVDANTAWNSEWVPAVTANAHYTAGSWTPAFPGSITEDCVFTMQYELNKYTVTFNVGANGTFDAPLTGTQKVYTVDTGTTWDSAWVPAVTANAGYRTDGWDPSPFATKVTGNLTYTMQYVQQHTVTFNVGANGTFDAPLTGTQKVYTVDTGTTWDSAWVPAVTANAGYRTDGWDPSPFATKVTGNLTYTMQYVQQHTVTFNVGANGTFDAPLTGTQKVYTVDTGTTWDSAWVPAVTANAGYRTDGWDPSPFATKVTGNLTYTMQYVQQHTVTFNVGANGTFDAPLTGTQKVYTVDTGTTWDSAWVPAVTANAGYRTDGWDPSPFATKVTGNLTYTMQYVQQYTVTFNVGANGTFDAPLTGTQKMYTVDTGTTWDSAWVPAVTANAGYRTDGWDPSPFATKVTGNLTYTMQYVQQHTVTFNVGANGTFDAPLTGTQKVYTVDTGTTWDSAWVPAVTANAGYRTDGWDPSPFATKVTGNLTYTMQYVQQHTVTFNVGANGTFDAPLTGTQKVYTVDTGTTWDSAWVPAVTANAGYRTDGWDPSPFATKVTGNLTYTMQYVQQHTVTFNVGANGTFDAPLTGTQKVYTVDTGTTWDSAWVPAVTANAGYRTDGWDPSPFATKVTGNLTYTMQYVQQHTVTFNVGANGTFDAPLTGTQKVYTVDTGTTWDSAWVPAVTANAGYRTDGWDSTFPAKIDKNHEFTMQYVQQYTVTFNVGANGTFDAPLTGTQKVYTVDTGTTWDSEWVPAVTANAGFRTEGWDSTFPAKIDKDYIVTMKYVQQIKITFVASPTNLGTVNGKASDFIEVDAGTAWDKSTMLAAAKAASGAHFVRWDNLPADGAKLTADVTITAVFATDATPPVTPPTTPPTTPDSSSSGSTPRGGGGSSSSSSSDASGSDSSSSSASEAPPTDSSVISIPDETAPAAFDGIASWSLIDLIVSVVNLVLAIVTLGGMIFSRKKDEDEDEENEKEKKLTITKILIFALGAFTPILFLILESLFSKMVIIGPYTIIFAVLFVLQAVLMVLSRKTKENQEEEYHA